MRLTLTILLLIALPARADDLKITRAESLINAFQVMCFLGDPNYDQFDAKAAAMRMKIAMDHPPPGPPGVNVRGRVWVGNLKSGLFGFHLYEQKAQQGVVSDCGVSGVVPDVASFPNDMVRVMKLRALPPSAPDAAGNVGYIWNDMPEPNHRLILRIVTDKTRPTTVMMTYSVKASR